VSPVASVLLTVLTVFWLLLIVRLIFEWVFMFARSFRPSGALAGLLEIVYSITDPPVNAVRRVLPPLRLGGVALDLSLLVVFVLVAVLRNVVAGL
jgi:YggT family protein